MKSGLIWLTNGMTPGWDANKKQNMKLELEKQDQIK